MAVYQLDKAWQNEAKMCRSTCVYLLKAGDTTVSRVSAVAHWPALFSCDVLNFSTFRWLRVLMHDLSVSARPPLVTSRSLSKGASPTHCTVMSGKYTAAAGKIHGKCSSCCLQMHDRDTQHRLAATCRFRQQHSKPGQSVGLEPKQRKFFSVQMMQVWKIPDSGKDSQTRHATLWKFD